MIKININLTNSKILADFVILASIIYGFIYKDSSVFLAGVGIGAAALGWKQHKTKQIKEIEKQYG